MHVVHAIIKFVMFSLFLCVYLCYYIYIACKYCNKRPLEKQVPTSPEELPFLNIFK
jgi:hypothetical protein